jgi:hypothetical protein
LEGCAPELLQRLIQSAATRELDIDEELTDFGLVLVVTGALAMCAAENDLAAAACGPGALVANLQPSGIDPVRVVSCEPSTIAVVERSAVEEALAGANEVLEKLRAASLEASARAAAVAGRLGDIDEATRFSLLERATLRWIEPREAFLRAGTRSPGLAVVGSGSLQVGDAELGPGDLVFPHLASARQTIPSTVLAGKRGARVLVIAPGALNVLSASNAAVSALLEESS